MLRFNPLTISLFIFLVGNIINKTPIDCCLFAITSILFIMSFFGYISTLTKNEKTTLYDKWLSEFKLDVKQKMKSKILFAFIGIIIMAMIVFLGLKFNESVACIVMDAIYFGIFYTVLYAILNLHQKENKMMNFLDKHTKETVSALVSSIIIILIYHPNIWVLLMFIFTVLIAIIWLKDHNWKYQFLLPSICISACIGLAVAFFEKSNF